MKAARIRMAIDDHVIEVPAGINVAAAIARSGRPFRRSVHGHARAPLCGMGICFECRVRIDGIAQQRACMVTVHEGMQVQTDA